MSSNPTQPTFGDQGEGVSFPPEDDTEGHRVSSHADAGGPEDFRAALADDGDDTEGHRVSSHADAGGPEGLASL